MKVKELRIGNLVLNQWGEIDSVEQIGISLVQFENGYCREDDLKPIPLTEEWLLKFGFEPFFGLGLVKRGLSVDGTVAHFSFDYWRLGDQANYLENDDFVEIPIEIKYVHQLQNLYYALTGEELTIN